MCQRAVELDTQAGVAERLLDRRLQSGHHRGWPVRGRSDGELGRQSGPWIEQRGADRILHRAGRLVQNDEVAHGLVERTDRDVICPAVIILERKIEVIGSERAEVGGAAGCREITGPQRYQRRYRRELLERRARHRLRCSKPRNQVVHQVPLERQGGQNVRVGVSGRYRGVAPGRNAILRGVSEQLGQRNERGRQTTDGRLSILDTHTHYAGDGSTEQASGEHGFHIAAVDPLRGPGNRSGVAART